MSRMVARLIPFYEFDINDFFRADGAPDAICTQRQDGFFRLATLYDELVGVLPAIDRGSCAARSPTSNPPRPTGCRSSSGRLVREHLGTGAFMQSSAGVTVTDLDGNFVLRPDRLLRRQYPRQFHFYKDCIEKAEDPRAPSSARQARGFVSSDLRSIMAPAKLCEISGLDEVSFHMSEHRSGDAGGAAGALSHAAARAWFVSPAPITAGGDDVQSPQRRQSGVAARDLYAGRYVGRTLQWRKS